QGTRTRCTRGGASGGRASRRPAAAPRECTARARARARLLRLARVRTRNRRVQALASGEEPPTPFMLAYRAAEDGDLKRLRVLLDEHPEVVRQRGTNG